MTNVVRQKSKTCIEWTVKLITEQGSNTIDSGGFIFQDCKYKLQLYTEHADFSNASLFFESVEKLNPMEVIVVVPKTHEYPYFDFERVYIGSKKQCIWNRRSCALRNFLLTFVIIFYTDPLKEDKCVETSSYLNADLSLESLSKDFSKLLDTSLNHDAEIKCGKHSVKVHKIVLCTRSDVFKAMLQSDMLEGRTGVVEIQDIDASLIQDFVRYLYTDTLPELTFDKAKILYGAGDKYAVRSLMFRCSEYLEDNLSLENACECLALADAHSDHKLKDKAVTYILDEKIYLQDEHWLPMCEKYPKIAIEVYRLSYKNIAESKDL